MTGCTRSPVDRTARYRRPQLMVGAVERVRAGSGSEVMQRIRCPDDRRNGILNDPHLGGSFGRLWRREGLAAALTGGIDESRHFNAAQHAYNGEQR